MRFYENTFNKMKSLAALLSPFFNFHLKKIFFKNIFIYWYAFMFLPKYFLIEEKIWTSYRKTYLGTRSALINFHICIISHSDIFYGKGRLSSDIIYCLQSCCTWIRFLMYVKSHSVLNLLIAFKFVVYILNTFVKLNGKLYNSHPLHMLILDNLI